MYSIFLARFVGEGDAFRGFLANFSTSKKVSAIQSCFRSIGVRPLMVVTHVGDIPPRRTVVKKVGDFICIIPACSKFLRYRILKYLHGIIYSTVIIYKLRNRKRVSLFFSWDYLPDTLLPLLLQGPEVLGRTIVDVEESIGADPRAGYLFRVFERLVIRYVKLRTIGNNRETAKSLGVSHEGVFPGFFANSLSEEEKLLLRTKQKKFGNKTVVLFSGRIDSVRGAFEFVELARRFEVEPSIQFVMTGYGSKEEIDGIFRIAPTNLRFLPDLQRTQYIDSLFGADIAFNFISNQKFASNSFPSKVVEYLVGAAVVLTNHSIDVPSKRLIVCESLDSMEDFIMKYHVDRQRWRERYNSELVRNELKSYSIGSCASVFRRIFNE